MSLIIYNGSPRGEKSNSNIIIKWFLSDSNATDTVHYYLNKVNHHDTYAKEMTHSDHILMVFPLYVDGMPGQVKHFFEVLNNYKDGIKGKHITYIIHSGFTEAIQSRALERYLRRVSDILGLRCHGVIIIPGSEGFRLMPPKMTVKKHQAVARLAINFLTDTPYLEKDLHWLSKHETMPTHTKILYRLFVPLGLLNIYWNGQLKKNKAFDQRFAAPYQDQPTALNSSSAIVIRQ